MNKRNKTPLSLQMEAVECGAAALGAILAYHKKYVPLEELRVECGVTRDGVKASNILKAAARYGLDGHGYRVELDELHKVPTPAIIYWKFNHFVVYEGKASNGYHINDPASGHRMVTPAIFDQDFTGIALGFQPTASFVRSGARFSFLATCRRWTKNSFSAIGLLLLIGILLVVPGLALPALTQVVVDDVLIHGLTRWLTPILLILAAVGVTRFALEATKRGSPDGSVGAWSASSLIARLA
jgi:ABC-type bacteriocin/lantibiotic exporter with double-glycine peptidase domain